MSKTSLRLFRLARSQSDGEQGARFKSRASSPRPTENEHNGFSRVPSHALCYCARLNILSVLMSFKSLGLSAPLTRAIAEKGYSEATPIQREGIPAVMSGKDVMAAAQTGTGKTASFILPLLERLQSGPKVKSNNVRSLVLTPTRELAAQIQDNAEFYGKYTDLKSNVVFGGVKINPQMQKLRSGTDILIATPGRLLDLYSQNAVRFDQLEVLVLDEADRMLDMGFIRDIRKILNLLPKQRQNLMFSATFSPEIKELAHDIVNNPVEVSVSPENATAHTVEQWVIGVDKKSKTAALIDLIKTNNWFQVLVFSRTKHGANRLVVQLDKAGITAAAIHGNKSQGARTRALQAFKQGDIQILVATDIAARGIDIKELPHVINFDLPNVAEDYVHRIGRTGRAGSVGQAVSLVSIDEFDQLRAIERLTQKLLERRDLKGFAPNNPLPESKLQPPLKPKKPKKPKQKAEGASAQPAPRQNQPRRNRPADGTPKRKPRRFGGNRKKPVNRDL
ncbi:ATP-dependent RNA helicase RhlE [Marinobacterium sp. xm-a-127]|nr:ATP-dependent RNA helicase RhlE [Marinobacterium sp. xm-d-510]NRP97211.1 ATP-dependent RNA helicase RhlE [Marinobacterium sp. xm-a-127]